MVDLDSDPTKLLDVVETGKELLNSLFIFADSYDQQRFSRWIHNVKASDFGNLSLD